MAPFLIALTLIFVLALAVVVAFALPHLRAGSPVLTPEGERLARVVNRPVRRFTDPLRRRVRGRLVRPRAGAGATAGAGPFPLPPAVVASPYSSRSDEPAEPADDQPVDDQPVEIDVRWIDAPPPGARSHVASAGRRG